MAETQRTHTAPTAEPPTEWMRRIDGCPECVHNTEAPTTAEAVPGGYQTHYTCTDCGHEWATSWWEGDH